MLIILFLTTSFCRGLEFSFLLTSEEEYCFQDILARHTIIVGNIKAKWPTYYLRIYMENNDINDYMEEGEEQMTIDFTTKINGKYFICFKELKGENEISFNYLSGLDIADKTQLATRQDYLDLEKQFNSIDTLLIYLKQQLIVFSEISYKNEEIFEKLIEYSIYIDVSIILGVIIISVAQIHLIRRFLNYKKNK